MQLGSNSLVTTIDVIPQIGVDLYRRSVNGTAIQFTHTFEAFELKWYARIIVEFIFLFQQTGNVIPPQVKAGDEVLLPEYGGTKVELEDKQEFHLFRESDILAKVE